MPEAPQPVSVTDESNHDPVELPDPLAALDILSSDSTSVEPTVPVADSTSTADLLSALDSTPDSETEEAEISVADYKWKDSVLDSIIAKFEISDRDAFLVHATAYDANKNLYLTKKELTQAAKEWVEMKTPIADLEPVEEAIEAVVSAAEEPSESEDSEEEAS